MAVAHEMKTLHDHLLAQMERDANGWTKAQARTFAKELHALADKAAAFGEEKEEECDSITSPPVPSAVYVKPELRA